MASVPDTEIRVVDVPDRSRFGVRVDGELAGFAEYRRHSDVVAFTHTLIDAGFEGQGLGSRLVREALSQAGASGLSVLPFCPFVRGYIAAHDEFLDLVPGVMRAKVELSTDA
jgi:predicted GNAT family acetyltransferase